MGISEAATAKRLTRALAKLRKSFGQEGIQISVGAIRTALLAHAPSQCPPDLAARTISAALARQAGTTAAKLAASKTAGLLVHSTISSAFAGAMSAGWGYLIMAVVAIPMAIVGTHAILRRAPAPVAVNVPAIYTPGPARPVRVGILLSHFTATGPYLTSVPYAYKDGYLETDRALRTDPLFELIPIVEPGTAEDPDLLAALKTSFKGKPAIDATDRNQISTLDVIVCPRVWNETPEVMNAIESAVSRGAGLLVGAGFAMQTPGPGDRTDRLNGLAQGCWAMSDPQGIECDVIADHPLLGKLGKGSKVTLPANGECGLLPPGATALIEVTHEEEIAAVGMTRPVPAQYRFYPLFIGSLGKGKILSCAFTVWKPVPSDLQDATGGRFMIRCVKWLTNQPLD